jgi:glyoxylate/hydroxypyruvate reductase A
MNPIVFISGLDQQTQQTWFSRLNKQLPNEHLCLPQHLSEQQAEQVEIAIVADPDPEILKNFPNLVWMQSLWAGVDRLTGDLASSKVKLVRLIDPQLTQTMAQAVLAWTLYLHRNMAEYAKQQATKQWRQLPCPLAKDIRVGVLGVGVLGVAAINILVANGYQVSCWSRSSKQIVGAQHYSGAAGLALLLQQTDILISLLPLTKETHYLLDHQTLSILPKGAKLINFSRGAVLDTKALLLLLEQGHIAHAVLDVFEQEPLPQKSPLWQQKNVTVLPHISAPTNMDTASVIVAKNITHYRSTGTISEAIDSKKGY